MACIDCYYNLPNTPEGSGFTIPIIKNTLESRTILLVDKSMELKCFIDNDAENHM